MELDKTRVYTAVNAEELPIGSKCIFARCVFILKDHVRSDYPADVLISVGSDTTMERFESGDGEWYPLAYLIEPLKDTGYEPYKTLEEAKKYLAKHNFHVQKKRGWNIFKVWEGSPLELPHFKSLIVDGCAITQKDLFEDYVFADDGTPCGELVEE